MPFKLYNWCRMSLRYLLGVFCGENRLIGHEKRISALIEKTASKAGLSLHSLEVYHSFVVLDFSAPPELSPLNLVRMIKGVLGWYFRKNDGERGSIRDMPFILRTVGSQDKGDIFHLLLQAHEGAKVRNPGTEGA